MLWLCSHILTVPWPEASASGPSLLTEQRIKYLDCVTFKPKGGPGRGQGEGVGCLSQKSHTRTHTHTCLWGVEQHTGQFVARIRLHVGVAEAAQLVPGSQVETLGTKAGRRVTPGCGGLHSEQKPSWCVLFIGRVEEGGWAYLDGLFGIEQTSVNGAEQQVLQA